VLRLLQLGPADIVDEAAELVAGEIAAQGPPAEGERLVAGKSSIPAVRADRSASRRPSNVFSEPSQRPVAATSRMISAIALRLSTVPAWSASGTGSRSSSAMGGIICTIVGLPLIHSICVTCGTPRRSPLLKSSRGSGRLGPKLPSTLVFP